MGTSDITLIDMPILIIWNFNTLLYTRYSQKTSKNAQNTAETNSYAHRTYQWYHRAIACRGIGTYCRGSLVISNSRTHTNDDAIKSCPIGIGEYFMSLTTWLNTNHQLVSPNNRARCHRTFSAHTSNLLFRSSDNIKTVLIWSDGPTSD